MRIPPGLLSPATAARLSDLLTKLERGLDGRPSTGENVDVATRGGVTITNPRIVPRIIAKITGNDWENGGGYSSGSYSPDDCRYSWIEWEVGPDRCSGAEVPGGRRGYVDRFPAVEISGNTEVEDDVIVEMWLSPDGTHWRFTPGGAGTVIGDGLILDVVTCVTLVAGADTISPPPE